MKPIAYWGHKANRTIIIRQNYNFTSQNISGMLMISGFYMQSITQFYLNTQIVNISQQYFNFLISTQADCSINRLDLSFLFYYQSLAVKDYLITIKQYSYLQNNATISPVISQVDVSVFLFGMTGFGGITANSYVNMSWSVKN
jgi:hypothetical protein